MIEFTVYGEPGPQGSKRHVGHGRMIEASKKVGPWREAVVAAFLTKYKRPMLLKGPLVVTINFTVKKPASAPKTRQTWPEKRPDLDKLVRSTFDGLTQAGAWNDDSQAVALVATKNYPNEEQGLEIAGAYIEIREVIPSKVTIDNNKH